MSDNNGTIFLLSFLLGGVLGAGVGMLASPKSGKENREELSKVLEKVKGQAMMREKRLELRMFRAVDDITNKVIDILAEGKDLTEGRKEELLEAIAEAKRSLSRESTESAS